MSTYITTQETRVVYDLAEVWKSFLALPEEHTDDVRNFRDAIHTAQRIVLARPGRRQVNKLNALLASEKSPISPAETISELSNAKHRLA